jgi:glutaredoxin
MSKILVVYTLKGCGWCKEFKKILKENSIPFKNRDIEKYEEEYSLFVEMKNDFVPAFMIVNTETETAQLYAPEIDFQDLEEALGIVKENL